MSTIYIHKDDSGLTRKILIDQPFLVTNKKIRIPKYQFEEGMYIPVTSGNYELTRDRIFKEDTDYYYFQFPKIMVLKKG